MQPLGWCSRGSYRSLWRLLPLPCTVWHCHWPQTPEGLSATPLGCVSQASISKTAPGLPVCAQSSPALCWAPHPSDLQGLPFLRRSSLSGSMSHHQECFLLSVTRLSFMGYHGKKPDSSNFFQGQRSLLLTLREAFQFSETNPGDFVGETGLPRREARRIRAAGDGAPPWWRIGLTCLEL